MDESKLKELGFESAAELHRLVAQVDISTEERKQKFKRWQDEDGSKLGLEALMSHPSN